MGRGYVACCIGSAVGMLVLAGCADKPPADCNLSILEEFPITVTKDNGFLIPATMDGHETKLLIDTGAEVSWLFDNSLDRLGIKYSSFSVLNDVRGLGGTSRTGAVALSDLKLGDVSYGPVDMPVIVPDKSVQDARKKDKSKHAPPYAGMLGNNFLSNFDVEFDVPEHKIYILSQDHCKGVVQHWNGPLIAAPFRMSVPETDPTTGGIRPRMADDYKIRVPITVNGRPVLAILDSGAQNSYMTWEFASQLGISKDTPGVTKTEDVDGIDGHSVPGYHYRFSTFTIGDETLIGVPVEIGDVSQGRHAEFADIFILGADFFAKNRVYIAYKERMIYFTPYNFKYSDGTAGK